MECMLGSLVGRQEGMPAPCRDNTVTVSQGDPDYFSIKHFYLVTFFFLTFKTLLFFIRKEEGTWVVFIPSQNVAAGAVPIVSHVSIFIPAGGISLPEIY